MRLVNADDYEYPGDLIYMPTIDAVPVVRCKDCQLRGGITCPMLRLIPNGCVMNFADGTTDNGYCSRGVRKGANDG